MRRFGPTFLKREAKLTSSLRTHRPLIQTISTAALVVIASMTLALQCRVASLQSQYYSLQEEMSRIGLLPDIACRFLYKPDSTETTGGSWPSCFQYQNTGADTAFAIVYNGRHILVCDSLIIREQVMPEQFALRNSFSFTRDEGRMLSPGQMRDFKISISSNRFARLIEYYGGVVLFELELSYWDDSPRTQFQTKRYFAVNQSDLAGNEHGNLEQLAAGPYWLQKIDSLTRSGAVAELGLIYPEGINPELPDTNLVQYPIVLRGQVAVAFGAHPRTQRMTWLDSAVLIGDKLLTMSEARLLLQNRIEEK